MLYPLMLFGLLSLSIPIAIHLIQRQRLKPTPLATMGFLDREDVANAFAPTPRDVLQLLLRLLLLSLLVLLMARIVIPAGGGPRTSVVILDQSLSMQQQVLGDRSSFELHKQRIQELIENKRPEDRIALRLVGDTVTERTGFLKDPEALTQVLDGFTLSESGGLGVMPAVREAVQRLRSRREANPAVLVFSDHQSGKTRTSSNSSPRHWRRPHRAPSPDWCPTTSSASMARSCPTRPVGRSSSSR